MKQQQTNYISSCNPSSNLLNKNTWTRTEVAELTAVAISSTNLNNCIKNNSNNGNTTMIPPHNSFQYDLVKIENGLNSEEADIQLDAAKRLRVLLSSERELLIRQLIDKNWTPRLIKWLKLRDRPTLQVEALWALTNIAAGAPDNTSVLLQNGVISTLVSLLDSTNTEILEQSVWVLGNLASEGANSRDLILNAGAIPALVTSLQKLDPKKEENISLIRIITWTVSNLCDGQPRPVFDITSILPELAKLLLEKDTEIISHVCWAFSHLCDGPSTHIRSVVDSNVCKFLVGHLTHSSWRVTKPALRAIGNIVCAEDDHDYTQHIIDCGAVPVLRKLIGHSNREIQKEACWTLSNIAAGTVEQIQCVVDSDSVPQLIKLAMSETTDAEVRSEACWVVLNATSCGSDNQISYLVKEGCITVLGNLLEETSMVMMALEGLERILQVGENEAKLKKKPNPYASLIASKKIETLEKHKSSAVSKRASRIWRLHFVTCAICQSAFSKHSNDTFFCTECKCNVCKNCNCTIYHLQYQESLWKDETVKENEKKQTASKKNKRQKKRQRTKIKKNSTSNLKNENSIELNNNSNNNIKQDNEYEDIFSENDSINSIASDTDDDEYNNTNNPTIKRTENSSTHKMTKQDITTNGKKNLDEQLDDNDKLVSYLLETGSIMALAQRLDQDDDSVWTITEEDRKVIHA